MRVGELAAGRAGDKGPVLDLTLVARDAASYAQLERHLTADWVRQALNRVVPGPVQRYEVPGLLALKYVLPDALAGGVYATLRPGLHWQKAAIWLLLDLDVPGPNA
jgi:CubicO group peptidase (beta-lactamase class C family)